jgi:predicted DNA-binding protein (MmcQ/YjbR family)
MTLHDADAFREFIGTLRATSLHEQWDSVVAKVGGKVFALHGNGTNMVVFKVGEVSFAGLVEIEGVSQAPYFAKRQWVACLPGSLDEETLRAYLAASHDTVAGKLTRKARAELGL